MDRVFLTNRLYQAERHVASGERHIARQHDLIAELQRDGHDTTEAKALLKKFEELQTMHLNDRDRLLRELRGG
jgi:hypothetical protein